MIDDAKQIIAGHGRVEAAKVLGIDALGLAAWPNQAGKGLRAKFESSEPTTESTS